MDCQADPAALSPTGVWGAHTQGGGVGGSQHVHLQQVPTDGYGCLHRCQHGLLRIFAMLRRHVLHGLVRCFVISLHYF